MFNFSRPDIMIGQSISNAKKRYHCSLIDESYESRRKAHVARTGRHIEVPKSILQVGLDSPILLYATNNFQCYRSSMGEVGRGQQRTVRRIPEEMPTRYEKSATPHAGGSNPIIFSTLLEQSRV